jgi:thiamine-phosphate pyrophosphorylase
VSAQRLLCLVTDRRRLSPDADAATQTERLVAQVRAAARAGIDLIQVRERDLDALRLADLVGRLVTVTSEFPAKILVNDRLDVALAVGAQGVHLRSDSFGADRVRQLGGESLVVGRSVHSAVEAREAAERGGLDYIVLGTIFESISKPAALKPIGVAELARACAEVTLPVIGIGGITLDKAGVVARTGAGLASIGLFIPPDEAPLEPFVAAVIEAVRRAFDTYRAVPYH